MVKALFIASVFSLFFSVEESIAQIARDSNRTNIKVLDLFDPGEISNEIFLRTSEDIFGEQLQLMVDDLEVLSFFPPQLNSASLFDWRTVPVVSDMGAFQLFKKNHSKGDITEPGGKSNDHIDPHQKNTKPHILIRSRMVVDPEADDQDMYQNGYYRGSPVKTTSRIIAKNEDILFSLTQSKDPGEPLYFDHITGCFALRHSLEVTKEFSLANFVVGDYSLSFGNGLLFSKGYGLFPGRDVNSNVIPHSNGIKPYISSSSFRYFRGAAAELSAGIFSFSGFFSDRKIDATLDSITITSLYNSGYHRTTSELSRKDQAQSKVTGVHISMTPSIDEAFLEIAATGYSLNYDKIVMKDSLSLGFSGKDHSMISAEIRGGISSFSACGEYAHMNSDAGIENAIAASIIVAPMEFLEMSLNYRNLPSRFISPFGGTFGINSNDAQNETGWYVGSNLSLIPKSLWLFGAFSIAQTDDPGKSVWHYSDIRLGSKYVFQSFPLQLILQFRSYGKGQVFALSNDSLSKTSIKLDVYGEISKKITCSFRGESQRTVSETDGAAKNGTLIGVKMKYFPLQELVIGSGIMFFQTESYASRFYSNESDLSGTAPFVAMYGKGFRYYFQCSYEIMNALTLSARIAETKYTPSSGSIELHRMSMSMQFDLVI